MDINYGTNDTVQLDLFEADWQLENILFHTRLNRLVEENYAEDPADCYHTYPTDSEYCI